MNAGHDGYLESCVSSSSLDSKLGLLQKEEYIIMLI